MEVTELLRDNGKGLGDLERFVVLKAVALLSLGCKRSRDAFLAPYDDGILAFFDFLIFLDFVTFIKGFFVGEVVLGFETVTVSGLILRGYSKSFRSSSLEDSGGVLGVVSKFFLKMGILSPVRVFSGLMVQATPPSSSLGLKFGGKDCCLLGSSL